VRGKTKYVVLTVEEYNRLRECELETAIFEAKKDLEEGRTVQESVDEHLQRITRD
jgi:hypothetical protein